MNEKSEITVVEMGTESTELLSQIYKEAFRGSPEQQWGIKELGELLAISGTSSFVICHEGVPIGFAVIRLFADEGEIITFCILPNWCKNGYATLLLEWIIDAVQLQSIKRLFLEVRENNGAAIKLYKKGSFKTIGRRKGYYSSHQAENIDALVMQYQLIEQSS